MAPETPNRRIELEGRALVERLGGHWSSSGGLCRCPAHDDRWPSLSVRPGISRLLFHCFAGCSASQVMRALAIEGVFAPSADRASGSNGAQDLHSRRSSEGLSDRSAERVWTFARSIDGTPAALYLARRGLESDSPELRFNGRTPHMPSPMTRFRPALIAAVRNDFGLTGVQRTFLDGLDDRASGRERRASLGRFGSGAVRLGGVARRLGLAEGIESALSASVLFGMPCWATLGAERFGLVSLPEEIEELHLFLDHDSGGSRAELNARQAFAHVPIEVHVPPLSGDDWNDVLLRR